MISIVCAPQINTNDERVELIAWHIASGEFVQAGQDVADVETSKAAVTISAEGSGYIDYQLPKHAIVPVGAPLFRLASTLDELKEAEQAVAGSAVPAVQAASQLNALDAANHASLIEITDVRDAGRRPAAAHADSSAVRRATGAGPAMPFTTTRLSRQARLLAISQAPPEGELKSAGLVTAAVLRRLLQPQPLQSDGSPLTTQPPDAAGDGGSMPAARVEPVSLSKAAEIAALSDGARGSINSTLSVQFESASLRSRLLTERLFDGNPLPLVLYEAARLLRQWPELTACFRDEAIHYYDRADIGLAVDLGRGLKVITIVGADTLSPAELFDRILDIGSRYLDNRVRPGELVGSTVTVTDLSGHDILHFRPLINGEQSAIIGVGADRNLAGHPMCIHVTFDHRVTTGRQVALFLNELRARLVSYAQPASHDPSSDVPQHTEPAAPICCDRCGVESSKYNGSFKQDAYMLSYYREDGSMGAVCHRCLGGWN